MKKFLAIAFCMAILFCFASGDEKQSTDTVTLFPVLMNGKWGYIDRNGRKVIEPQFADYAPSDGAAPFSEGVAGVNVGTNLRPRWRYIDTSGKIVIVPEEPYPGREFD